MRDNASVKSKKKTFRERVTEGLSRWQLTGLFGSDLGTEVYDFEEFQYIHFLNHVSSREDLLRGFQELSPFADDALEVAERMTEEDFYEFKLALARERGLSARKEDVSNFPAKYATLLIPRHFIKGTFASKKFEVSLGCALVRMFELEKA